MNGITCASVPKSPSSKTKMPNVVEYKMEDEDMLHNEVQSNSYGLARPGSLTNTLPAMGGTMR